MKKYKIKIQGMHCNGCKNLIFMMLEEEGFSEIKVNLENQEANFSTNKDFDSIKKTLDKIFLELKDYKYSDLHEEN